MIIFYISGLCVIYSLDVVKDEKSCLFSTKYKFG